jgi:membrane associated rhomboid family serine protease
MADEDDPFAEIIATGALLLLVGAVIAGVIGAGEWGSGSSVTAVVASAAAAIGFAVSVACFMFDARRDEEATAELPFPSWLRNEADA